jgi:hypothetical protein
VLRNTNLGINQVKKFLMLGDKSPLAPGIVSICISICMFMAIMVYKRLRRFLPFEAISAFGYLDFLGCLLYNDQVVRHTV